MSDVVIARKDKRIRHWFTHGVAFAATGGLSGIVTVAEAANHASYNRRTRQLQSGGRKRLTKAEREYLRAHVPKN